MLYRISQRTGKTRRLHKYGQKFKTTEIVLIGQDDYYAEIYNEAFCANRVDHPQSKL
ncbi:hypothetical protein FD11_GL001328 [Ligilactobacillus pobuzihii E100301 = KCTC 13174]|uniref:Uncharacterized protein n=1 Tax=Ligilactobacillus pobuzihii TaxID=449659 RepID=A0A0R2LIN4_9LACO|nr:hypothetical protein FD11_GL001328 [Ligilactobacillus pobuzihii E100301 = KCTC 13174]KRO01647.1 hypothetical protein IV66_GL002161 [Ligilactobacillus pobuzihii]